jgi:hypothetical protein
VLKRVLRLFDQLVKCDKDRHCSKSADAVMDWLLRGEGSSE